MLYLYIAIKMWKKPSTVWYELDTQSFFCSFQPLDGKIDSRGIATDCKDGSGGTILQVSGENAFTSCLIHLIGCQPLVADVMTFLIVEMVLVDVTRLTIWLWKIHKMSNQNYTLQSSINYKTITFTMEAIISCSSLSPSQAATSGHMSRVKPSAHSTWQSLLKASIRGAISVWILSAKNKVSKKHYNTKTYNSKITYHGIICFFELQAAFFLYSYRLSCWVRVAEHKVANQHW